MTGSPRDQRHHEPASAEALEAEFGGWRVWQEDGLWWAQSLSPPVTLEGAADLGELRDWLIARKWKNSGG